MHNDMREERSSQPAAADAPFQAAASRAHDAPQPPTSKAVQLPTRDHVSAGLLAIFLGPLGIHKFYLGYNDVGFIMLAVTIIGSLLSFGLAGAVMWVFGIIEGVIYLSKSQSAFEEEYVRRHREWF